MIVLSIAHSLLTRSSPIDCVFCYLASIERIWSKAIVVLVYNNYIQRISFGIIVDLEKYSNVFSICLSLSIISFPVKASNHHSLVMREILGFRFFDKIWKRNSGLPFSCRSSSSIRDRFGECNTLSIIAHLRELRKEFIARILYTSRIRRIGNHSNVFTIHCNSWHRWIMIREDLPFWHNSFLPESLRDTSVIPWERECEWRLDEWHCIIISLKKLLGLNLNMINVQIWQSLVTFE